MNILIDTAIFSLQQHGGISRLWRALIPALQQALPDATFAAQLPPDWFISTYYRPAPPGVKSLVMVYDCIAERYPLIGPSHPDAVAKRRAVDNAQVITAISPTVQADVRRYFGREAVLTEPGIEPDYGHVLPSAVTAFQQRIGAPYVLVVGRRGLYKNVQALYQAWRLWPAASAFRLVCVGGEEPLPADRAFAQRYPWQRMDLSDDELRAAYAGAVALVYPSLMEGFGLPVLEAMACGCPVICDHALHDVTGSAALEVDMTRPLQLAQALDSLRDPGARLAYVLGGVDRAKAFSWARMAQQVKEALVA